MMTVQAIDPNDPAPARAVSISTAGYTVSPKAQSVLLVVASAAGEVASLDMTKVPRRGGVTTTRINGRLVLLPDLRAWRNPNPRFGLRP